jgi:hypothetical protein
MENNNLVLIEQICLYHDIEVSFVNSLHEFGLIEVIVVENNRYLSHEQLRDLEKLIRLHYDLNINLEGIDAVSMLLRQIEALREELKNTRNKLRVFEVV